MEMMGQEFMGQEILGIVSKSETHEVLDLPVFLVIVYVVRTAVSQSDC